jgi:hypothetical protein
MHYTMSLTQVRLIGCVMLSFLTGCGGGDDPLGQVIGVEVRASPAGSGAGRVTGDSAVTIDCLITDSSAPCSRTFPDAGAGGAFTLTATPDAGSDFVQWSASCIADKAGECAVDCGPDMKSSVCTMSFSQDAGDVRFFATAQFDALAAASVTLEDMFASDCAAWTSTLWSSTGAVSAAEDCPATGGDGDSRYRQMTHQVIGAGNLVVFHGFDGATYDPSTQGSMAEVRYSWLRKVVTPAFVGAGVGEAIGLLQDGKLYTVSLGAFSNTTWQATSGAVTASDFLPAPGPDFTATGGPIQFGYLRSNTNTSAGSTQTMVHGIDNWRVVIVPD